MSHPNLPPESSAAPLPASALAPAAAGVYTQGHSPSAIASHASRTIHNSATFLTPYIAPHHRILDLGCGPGTITAGFASLVPRGHVVGVDLAESVLETARARFPAARHPNLSFRAADVTARLPFDDGSFDVVFTSQTVCHVPVGQVAGLLRECRRVLAAGGVLAMREYDTMEWHPASAGTDMYRGCMNRSIGLTGAQGAGTGRRLHGWAAEAGFEVRKMQVGAGTVVYAREEEVRWWSGVHVGRLQGEIGRAWVSNGVCGEGDIETMQRGLAEWCAAEGAWYGGMQGEVLAWK